MGQENIRSKVWQETSEEDDPFSAKTCHCAGYDVYGEMLKKASWIEYLFLLIKGDRPSKTEARLLEGLAIALANPGPRDHSVRGAMNAAVGGSTSAACLISALAVGAGNLGGSREVYEAMLAWQHCSDDLVQWEKYLVEPAEKIGEDIWRELEHPPGFYPYGNNCALPVKQTLEFLADVSEGNALVWLQANRIRLEKMVGMPLSMSGVAAACFVDLGFDEHQAEIIFLLLRLPGAAAHSLEQRVWGWRHYPFFADAMHLENDPQQQNVMDSAVKYDVRESEVHE